jgi:glyoxylase-like metal-dependent hydrolase (beta-lactamase superfamily II)
VRWQLGAVTLTVVPEPDFEVLVPQDERTTEVVLAQPWLAPYRTTEGVLRVTTSAVVVQTPETCVVVDPWVALDDEDRTSETAKARAARRFDALTRVGIDPLDVDVVVNSHIDGIGANAEPTAVAGEPEVPGFANASYLLSAGECDALAAGERPGAQPFADLRDAGVLQAVTAPHRIDDYVTVVAAPGHRPEHCAIEISSRHEHAIIIGHMFLHPASLVNPDAGLLDEDPATNAQTRRATLQRCARERALLIGPLFAAPGGGYVEADGDGWRLIESRPA